MRRIARPTSVFCHCAEGQPAQSPSARRTVGAGCSVCVGVNDAASAELLLVDELVLEVVRPIADGGMSGIYEAVVAAATGVIPEGFLGRRVVLKVADSARYAANEWSHLREFRHMSVLPEPYVFGSVRFPPDFDAGASVKPSDTAMLRAIVMELIEGDDMTSWSRGWERDCATPPPLESVLDAMNPVLDFMKVVSTARPPLVHRDIKPENLIVQRTPAGFRCRLVDLGIAGRVPSADGEDAIGTRGFAAPEVLRPSPGTSAVDPRVDTFGLAATLYGVLSGGVYGYAWHGGFPVAHDEGLRRSLCESLLRTLPAKVGVDADPAIVDAAVDEAFRAIDGEFMESLRVGLSTDQAARPFPGDFADRLPRLRIESLLELHAASAYSRLASARQACRAGAKASSTFVDARLDVQGSTLSDALRYDGFDTDFVHAMDAWNRGRYHDAVPLLRRLADAGDATSQYNLGICIRDGLGGAQGTPEEVVWRWTKAADGGHIVAMYNIGLCLERGWGVAEGGGGLAAALKWYRRAADEGFPLARERIALIEGDASAHP